jgi:hypothetical protein
VFASQLDTLDSSLFYGGPNRRLRCLADVAMPSWEERKRVYLEGAHDGHGGSVAIPISFWNKAVRKERERMAATATAAAAAPPARERIAQV